MTLAGGRTDVSQLTSMLPLGQLAGEVRHCLPLEFTDVPSETCLYTEGDQTVPNLALLFNTAGELRICELVLIKKSHRTVSGESHIMWQRLKQAVIWIVIYGVIPMGTVSLSWNTEKTVLKPTLVLLLPERSSSASSSLVQANIP